MPKRKKPARAEPDRLASRTRTAKAPSVRRWNGNVPPAEHRFKPGESGNPRGRASAGAALIDWLNIFATQHLAEDELRSIARDHRSPWPRRAAAERALRTLEAPDLADLQDYLETGKSLGTAGA